MFAYFQVPTSWSDVLKRTVHEIGDDNCVGMAAQLAFYFLLALFPALLFVVALVGYLPVEGALGELLLALAAIAPSELIALLREQLDQIAAGNRASLLTLGIVGAIWSSSAAMVAIIDALNRAYDIAEWRPWWKRRLVAILLTIALAVFILLSIGFVLIGPGLAARLTDWLGLAGSVAIVWQILRWPLMVVLVVLAVDLVYHFAPNRPSRWVWITPGSLVATALWILSSFAFKFYVANFGDYTATYGAIGAVIVTMLWFYVGSMAVLVGAEINAVIETMQAAARPRAPAR
jgi:membrane protein